MRARQVTCIPMEKVRRDLNVSDAVFLHIPVSLQSCSIFPRIPLAVVAYGRLTTRSVCPRYELSADHMSPHSSQARPAPGLARVSADPMFPHSSQARPAPGLARVSADHMSHTPLRHGRPRDSPVSLLTPCPPTPLRHGRPRDSPVSLLTTCPTLLSGTAGPGTRPCLC